MLVKGTDVTAVRKKILADSVENGLFTVKVSSVKSVEDTLSGIEKKKWDKNKLISFTNRLKSLLEIQLNMDQILKIMYREGSDPVILKLLYETSVLNRFIDEAMETMPKVFPKDYC